MVATFFCLKIEKLKELASYFLHYYFTNLNSNVVLIKSKIIS